MSKGDRDRNTKISKTRSGLRMTQGAPKHFYTGILALAVAKQYKVQEDKMLNRGQNLLASGPTEQRGFYCYTLESFPLHLQMRYGGKAASCRPTYLIHYDTFVHTA